MYLKLKDTSVIMISNFQEDKESHFMKFELQGFMDTKLKGTRGWKLKGTAVTKITNYRKENFSSFGLSENLFCHIDANWFMTV